MIVGPQWRALILYTCRSGPRRNYMEIVWPTPNFGITMKPGVWTSHGLTVLRQRVRQCMRCRFAVEYRSRMACLTAPEVCSHNRPATACGRKWRSCTSCCAALAELALAHVRVTQL